MTEFLYQIKLARLALLDDGGTQAEQAALAEHFEYLKELHNKGVARFVGRIMTNDENAFGLVVFDAEDEAAATALANADPAVQRGVMRAAVFPFRTVFD